MAKSTRNQHQLECTALRTAPARTEVSDAQMSGLMDILCRALREELQYVGNQRGWVQQYHAEQKMKGKR